MLFFLYFYTTSWVGPCGYYLYNVPIPESYLSINLTSIIWWLADYNLSLISDCCCCDGGTHPEYIDGRHHAVFMVWGNLSSLLFPDYTLYIYDIHLLLVVGCLLLSTSRTSMAIAVFSFYDMIWRFLKPIEPLLPANKWPLFCNINTLGRSLVFFGPKVKGKSRWTFWIQQDFKESMHCGSYLSRRGLGRGQQI